VASDDQQGSETAMFWRPPEPPSARPNGQGSALDTAGQRVENSGTNPIPRPVSPPQAAVATKASSEPPSTMAHVIDVMMGSDPYEEPYPVPTESVGTNPMTTTATEPKEAGTDE